MNKKNAITLIEIVVSMAVTSIIILAAYSFFNASIKSWDYSSSSMNAAENSIFIIDFLEKTIKDKSFQVDKWFVGGMNTNVAQVETKIAENGPWSIVFKDGIFLPFKSEDEMPEHADYYGIYRNNSSNEVILYKNTYKKITGSRMKETTVLGRNITDIEFYFFDTNWDTLEVWDGNTHIYGSNEVKSFNIKVLSTVGMETSSSSKTVTLWRK